MTSNQYPNCMQCSNYTLCTMSAKEKIKCIWFEDLSYRTDLLENIDKLDENVYLYKKWKSKYSSTVKHKKQLKEGLQLKMVSESVESLKYIQNPTEKVKTMCLVKDPLSIYFIKEPTKQELKLALREICMKTVDKCEKRNNPAAGFKMHKITARLILEIDRCFKVEN